MDPVDKYNNLKDGDNYSDSISNELAGITLHPIEKKILSVLQQSVNNWMTETSLAEKTKLTSDQIRRGIEWLRYKNLIQIISSTDYEIALDKSNKNVLEKKYTLPERKLINLVKSGKKKLPEILNSSEFIDNNKEVFGAIRFCKNNDWIEIHDDIITLLPNSENLSQEEMLIDKIDKTDSVTLFSQLDKQEKICFESLKKRPNILIVNKLAEKKFKISEDGLSVLKRMLSLSKNIVRNFTVENLVTGKWKELEFEQIDVEAPLPLLNYGKKNPLVDFIDEVKEILVGMGFSEIEGDLIQSSFWNFDALFIPQDHTARDMQDTFYVSTKNKLEPDLPHDEDLIKRVASVHQQNWQYIWKKEESVQYVLRTHTTPVTIQYLSNTKPEQDKVFLIGRVFRNEKVSFKHLVEFHQVEGIYTHKNANLRELIGIQSEFYKKMGIKKIKFWPTFFPYTEPSLQSMIYNERMDKWMELFGMGIFRPEVTKPLGIDNPVLAWGGGFERLAMLRFDLNDIRELYSNNLSWLKGVPKCLL